MPTYAVTYDYTDDTAALAAARPDHRAYLGGLQQKGLLRASGPTAASADQPAGALLLFEAGTADEVDALLDADPFVLAGLVARRSVREWTVVIGSIGS